MLIRLWIFLTEFLGIICSITSFWRIKNSQLSSYTIKGKILLKSIHWVNSSARSSFFEKHIILTKPFQPTRADISCSFSEKDIIVQSFLLSEWALEVLLVWQQNYFFVLTDITPSSLYSTPWKPCNEMHSTLKVS